MADVERDLAAIRELKAAIDGAGLMACVHYYTMARLSSLSNWYGWASYGGHTGLIEVPLSDAREMLRRSETTITELVSKALQ